MKYYLIAGEASGDLHASNLMKSLKNLDREADFRFFGGDLMQNVGGVLVRHYREMAYMGFIPVLLNLRTIFRNMNLCKQDIEQYNPDGVILIDYPGFNLKIAKYVKTILRIPVYYYISPKIWAWKKYRIKSIRKYVDKMLSILPFEVEFYKKYDCKVDYVGNPTVDAISNRDYAGETFEEFIRINQLPEKPVIALVAGSRKQEIKDNLPTMISIVSKFPDYQAIIAGAPGIDMAYYLSFLKNTTVNIVFGQTYRLLQQSYAALVTSGTATLETALLKIPQAVCYKVPLKHISSFVFKHFFSVKYISLVNLIAGKTVVKELFGKHFSEKTIADELHELINNVSYRSEMLHHYNEVIDILGQPKASQQAAEIIIKGLTKKNINIKTYDYTLPDEKIAKYPLPQRDESKLLIYRNNKIEESRFKQLNDYLPENSLLIFNNTKVIQARLIFQKETGAQIEIFCLEPKEPADYAQVFIQNRSCVWLCMIGNLKKWKSGKLECAVYGVRCTAERLESYGDTHWVRFEWDNPNLSFAEILETCGELPIPPYLNRKTEESDNQTYQTVYSKIKGSVAAPTAGLHFTKDVFDSLSEKNIDFEELTLHVGAGTFKPVKTETIEEHVMHAECITVKKSTVEKVLDNLGNIFAVGTTSVRTLESLYYIGVLVSHNPNVLVQDMEVTQWMPYNAANNRMPVSEALNILLRYFNQNHLNSLTAHTQMMIVPGYRFNIVTGMITNFHQPKSTLLLLISAFVGDQWKNIYDYALSHDFRFLSYGDSSLLFPHTQTQTKIS